jgi:hypothetical protein
LVDVLVTQLNLLKRHAPETLAGHNLLALLDPGVPAVPVFLDLNLVAGLKQELYVSNGVVLGDYKYFEELAPEPRTFLFNLRDDPGETKNLADELPKRTAELSLLLRMQRASEGSGLVIKGVGSHGTKGAHWSLTMTTDGQFIEATSLDLESEDSIEYEPGGSILTVNCDLQAGQDNLADNKLIQDSDTITIRIDPPDARVFIQRTRLGQSDRMPLFLGPKRKKHLAPVDFAANQEDLRMEQLSTLFTKLERDPREKDRRNAIPPGVYIVRLPDAKAGDIEIPAEMVERLKALGYM